MRISAAPSIGTVYKETQRQASLAKYPTETARPQDGMHTEQYQLFPPFDMASCLYCNRQEDQHYKLNTGD